MYFLSFKCLEEQSDEERADLQALFVRAAKFMAAFEAAVRCELLIAKVAERDRGYTVDSGGKLVTVTVEGPREDSMDSVFSKTIETVSVTEPDWKYRPPELVFAILPQDRDGGLVN